MAGFNSGALRRLLEPKHLAWYSTPSTRMETPVLQAAEALETLASHLSQKGLKFTAQRRLITEVFFDPERRDEHPSTEELYLRVRARDPKVGYATVYRTLKILVDCKLAKPSRFGDNQTRYEPEVSGEHHDHMVCTACGAVIEFHNDAIERLQEAVARELGYELTDHKMVLYGRPVEGCARCNENNTTTRIERSER